MKTIKNKQLLVLAVLFLVGLSINAQDTFILRSALNNSLVLSIENNSNSIRANAQVKTYNRKRTQQWIVVPSNERNFFYLKSKASNYVLDIKNGSSSIRTSVWMYARNNGSAQKWQKIPVGNGYFYLKSKLGTFLDIKGGVNRSGTPVWTYVSNRSKAQKWKFDPVDQSLRIPSRCSLTRCDQVERGDIRIVNAEGQYIVSDHLGGGLNSYLFPAPTRTEAQKIKDILFGYYDIDKFCTFEEVTFPYRRGNIITGVALREDCLSFNPLNLTTQRVRNGKWTIKDGNSLLIETSSKENSLKMICLIQKLALKKLCYVGRPDPSLTYLRK